MTTNYERGRAQEYKYRDLLKQRGCTWAARTAGSHSLFDVAAVDAMCSVYLVQVKTTKQCNRRHYLNVSDCLAIQEWAEDIGFGPDTPYLFIRYVVWVQYHKWYEYELVQRGNHYVWKELYGGRYFGIDYLGQVLDITEVV